MTRSECRYRNRRLPARMKWLRNWLDAGSRAVLARDPRTGRFCYGDRLTIADICLVAHLTSAKLLCDSPDYRGATERAPCCERGGEDRTRPTISAPGRNFRKML